MKKSIWRKIVSVLCIVSMVITMYAPSMVTQAETTEAETTDETVTEQITLDDMGLEFLRLGFADFGISEETQVTNFTEATSKFACTSSETATGANSKWDKTITYGKVKIGASTSNEIHFVNNSWGHRNAGLFLRGTTGGNLGYYFVGGTTNSGTLSSTVAGQKLTETWIDLAVSIEVLASSTSVGSIRVGFFINGNLYNNEFITMTGINTDYLGSRALIIKGSGTNGVTLAPSTLCGETETLTLKDMSIADHDAISSIVSGTYTESLFGKKIKMVVSGELNGKVCLMPHASTHYGGWQMVINGTSQIWVQPAGLVNKYYNFTNAGVDLTSDTYLFEVYLNTVDYDYDGTKDDIFAAMWVNGVLCDSGTIVLKGESYSNTILSDKFTNDTRLSFHQNSTTAFGIYSVPETGLQGNFVDITQADFATDGTQWADKREEITGEMGTLRSELVQGLKGTKLNVDVMFPESSEAKFYYGASSEQDGLSIYSDESGNLVIFDNVKTNNIVATLTPEIAGTTLIGERIHLQISYENEFVISDGDASLNAKLGIYINGELYNDSYLYVKGLGNALGKGIKTVGTDSDSVTIWMPVKSKEINAELTPITVTDFSGLSDNYKNTGGGTGSTYKNGAVLDTVFSTKMKLKVGNYFHYAGIGAWYGLRFHADNQNTLSLRFVYDGGNVSLTSFTSAVAGTDLVGNDVLIQISVQAADFDRDGTEDDLIVGVFFDGKLYNNRYLFISSDGVNIQTDWLGRWFAINPSNGGTLEYYSITDWRQEVVLETVPADYNIADGTYAENVRGSLGNAYSESIDMNGKLLSTDVTFSDGGIIKLAGAYTDSGIQIYRSGEKLYLASVDGEVLSATEINLESVYLSAADKTFNLKVSVEYEELDGLGNADDVKVGLWIDNHFYNNDYFYLYNCADSFGSYIEATGVTIVSEERSMPEDYTEYVFEDYDGLTYMLYEEDATGTISTMVSDEMVFTDKVLLKNDAMVELAGYKMAVTDGILSVSAQDVDLMQNDVSGSNTYSFAFVQKRVDADEDGNRDDIALGVFVNGVMYNNRYFFLLDYQEKVTNVCTITVNDGYVSLKEIYEKAPMPIDLDENANGFVLSTEQTSVVVNAEEVDVTVNPNLDSAGDYRISYTDAEGVAVTQVVALYRLGDTNADDKTNVKDLVAVKKAMAETTELTRAGEYAADLNNDDTVSKEDTTLLRSLLCEEKTAAEIKEEMDKTTFGIISDVHLDHKFDQREDNLEKALKYYRKNGVELIIVNGDISDYGTVTSYKDFVEIFTTIYPDEAYWPEIIVTSDNHEYFEAWPWLSSYDGTTTYEDMQERFITYLAEPLNQKSEAGVNTYVTEDGYYFIGISSDTAGDAGTCTYDEETVAYLQAKLEEAKAVAIAGNNPDRPIFVAVHQPPTGTVVTGANSALNSIFEQYPQIVLFTSHSHTSVKQENNIWQGEYTVVNTSSLYYVGSAGVKYTNSGLTNGKTIYDFGEGLLVHAKGNEVSIQRYDFFNDEEIKDNWVVTTSADGSTLTDYTEARTEKRVAPTWGENTSIEISKTGDTTVKLTFASATHEDFVQYYKVKITDAATGTSTVKVYRNDFFLGLTRMADMQKLTVTGLTVRTEYTFEVTAVETFGHESEAITVTYTMN